MIGAAATPSDTPHIAMVGIEAMGGRIKTHPELHDGLLNQMPDDDLLYLVPRIHDLLRDHPEHVREQATRAALMAVVELADLKAGAEFAQTMTAKVGHIAVGSV